MDITDLPLKLWNNLCAELYQPQTLDTGHLVFDFKFIETQALLRMTELENCLYELYAYQHIHDVPTLTELINQLSEVQFTLREINPSLRKIRRLVSLRYNIENRGIKCKEREKEPLDPGELSWVQGINCCCRGRENVG